MKRNVRSITLILVVTVSVLMLTGCTNWKKKYEGLQVANQNLEGRLEGCMSSLDESASGRSQLGDQLADSQKTIAELQREIDERNADPGKITGFEGLDVSVDSAAGTITVTLENKILFSSGKATLKRTSIAELDQIRNVLRQRYSSLKVDVVGHTDSDPIKKSGWKDNWQLSAERALSVTRYMLGKGIRPELIRAVAAGEHQPIASNSSASGKARNRRVDVVVRTR